MTIDHKPHNLKYKININVTENYKEIVINKVKYKYMTIKPTDCSNN